MCQPVLCLTNLSSCTLFFSQEADNDPTGEAAANTQQTLTFYELDLGLNHVVRKYSEALEEHGNFLITGKLLDTCHSGFDYFNRLISNKSLCQQASTIYQDYQHVERVSVSEVS